MEFKRKWDEHKRYISEPGSGVRITYGSELDQNKNIIVKPKGEENLYAYINSFADSVDINVLLARFTNGDEMALKQRAASYIDISSLPTNLNEFIEYSRNATSFFETLPVTVKEKFNNNVLEFIAGIGTKEWDEIMNTSQAKEMKKTSDEARKKTKKLKDEVEHRPVIVPSVFDDTPIEEPIDEGDIK